MGSASASAAHAACALRLLLALAPMIPTSLPPALVGRLLAGVGEVCEGAHDPPVQRGALLLLEKLVSQPKALRLAFAAGGCALPVAPSCAATCIRGAWGAKTLLLGLGLGRTCTFLGVWNLRNLHQSALAASLTCRAGGRGEVHTKASVFVEH